MDCQYSILIVEDDSLLASSMALILEMEGFEVRVAGDGATGLALVRQQRPDLILCDILMPGMDGYGFHAALIAEPNLADILFIFVTALSDPLQVRRGMLAGADDYLAKPFSSQELVAAVAARLRRVQILQGRASAVRCRVSAEHLGLLQQLTRRERQILFLVAQGATSKEIADQLFISPRTVEVHRTRLMKKLGVANAVALSHWAVTAEQLGHLWEPKAAEMQSVIPGQDGGG